MAINDKLLKSAAASGGGLVPSENFQTVIWDGDNATARNITALNFKPDFVWFKSRTLAASNNIIDSVRGSANRLVSDNNSRDVAQSENGYVSSFIDNGFVLQKGSSSDATYTGWFETNQSGQKYVARCWKVPDAFSHSASGSQLASTGKSNQAAGISIVSYTGNGSTGATVKHNLGGIPDLIITKNSSGASSWAVWSSTFTAASETLFLDLTSPSNQYVNRFGTVNSSTFQSGSNGGDAVNKNGGDMIAYCFKSKVGYSKVGKYTGNGSSNGPIVDCGFEPAFLLIKDTGDSGGGWYMYDNKRNTTNSRFSYLQANESAAEISTGSPRKDVDFTTTGFKIQNNAAGWNKNNNVFIFYAIAADPDTTTPTLAKSFNIDAYTGNGATQQIGSVNTLFTKFGIFNGSNSGIAVSNQPIPAGATSISFWYNGNNNSGTQYILGNGIATASKGVTVYFHNNAFGALVAKGTSSLAGSATSSTTYSNSKWHHIVFTWDGSSNSNAFKVYVNGGFAVQGTSDTSSASIGTYTSFAMGALSGGVYAAGKLDQVRIYNTVINQAAVTQLYNETQASASTLNFPVGLGGRALYEFNDDGDSTSSSTYNGVVSNVTFDSFLFKPDLVIIKNKSSNQQNWYWADSVRGVSQQLRSDGSGNQNDDGAFGVTGFNNAGFTVTDIAGGNHNVNGAVNGQYSGAAQFIAYSFKMLDNSNSLPVENEVGTIDSLTSVNAAAGMSIAKYIGNKTQNATIGHGLSSVPDMVIIKNLSQNDGWIVSHSGLSSNEFMELNEDAAATTNSDLNHERLSTTFKTTSSSPHDAFNGSGESYIMYSFITTSSFSKFGSYEGGQNTGVNNQVDFGSNMAGVDFVMVKNADAGGSQWMVFDTERTNGMALYMNTVAAESNYIGDLTISSQGLRFGSTNINVNRANETYIYWAMKIN